MVPKSKMTHIETFEYAKTVFEPIIETINQFEPETLLLLTRYVFQEAAYLALAIGKRNDPETLRNDLDYIIDDTDVDDTNE